MTASAPCMAKSSLITASNAEKRLIGVRFGIKQRGSKTTYLQKGSKVDSNACAEDCEDNAAFDDPKDFIATKSAKEEC